MAASAGVFADAKSPKPGAPHQFTVVIDAGHGGKDHGAIGPNAREKDVNLGVALKLKRLIDKRMKDSKVTMTRDDDTFVTLQGRADIANAANGDLFVSIHTNSVDAKSKNRTTVNGSSVYVLGRKSKENLAVAQRENAVMMLEDDYTTTYHGFDPNSPESYIAFELIQNQHMEHSLSAAQAIQSELVATAGRRDHGVRQAMFWVLVKTGMPAVLVELDFICNPTQARYLKSDAGQTQLAEAIFNGIEVYKTAYDREMAQMNGHTAPKSSSRTATTSTPTAPTTAPTQSDDSASGDIIYKVQFLTTTSPLPESSPKLKGLDNVSYYRDGKMYKYTSGAATSMGEARKTLSKVRKRYSDAFIIRTRNGQRIK